MKKKIILTLLSVFLVVGIVAGPVLAKDPDAGAQGQPFQELWEAIEQLRAARSLNPLQVALLRWYDANQAGNTFEVGNEPMGICFDGANIWVTNWVSGTVTKLKASDGSTVGTNTGGVDWGEPIGICFDGASIWVANSMDDTVTKLKASNGNTLGTYGVGFYPSGICFDGANIWVANRWSLTVSKL